MEQIVERAECPNYIRSFIHQELKDIDHEKRILTHLITTGLEDRAGDVVDPRGADTKNYMNNPIVTIDHTYRVDSVIGRALSLEISDDGITARTEFRRTQLAREAYQLAAERLGGWSIGFRPIEYDRLKDENGKEQRGYRFAKWELLEYAAVAIPMNPEVINGIIQRGLVSPENVPMFFRSITPEPAKIAAAPGPTAEAVELHPVTVAAIRRVRKRFAYADVSRAVREALEKIDGTV